MEVPVAQGVAQVRYSLRVTGATTSHTSRVEAKDGSRVRFMCGFCARSSNSLRLSALWSNLLR